jgi:2-polyprenyl-3-methyl-5-hydroxy-6-metoxy-1,4-benzoquinol methylase
MADAAQRACVICGGTLETRAAVALSRYSLFPCRACASWNMLPRPTTAEQSAFHDSAEYYDHPYLEHRRSNTAAVDRRCADLFERLRPFVDIATLRGERMLDVGCDTGQLVASAARQFGVVPAGVDVAHLAIRQARDAAVDAYVCTLEDAPAHITGLSLVTAVDLIEHVADPVGFFRSLSARLRPGGLVYVETPNVWSVVYRFGRLLSAATGGRPAGTIQRLFPPEHLQYFSREGVSRAAACAGLEVLKQDSRVLPAAEIAVDTVTRAGLGALQWLDYLGGEKILRWAVLRRPAAS